MRIGLIIADLEMSFTTSFKYTARVRYGVDFTDSNISTIQEKIQELKRKFYNPISQVHVGYEFNYVDIEHIENLLAKIVNCYLETISSNLSPQKKLYTIFKQLNDATISSPQDIAKEVLKQILTPSQPQKLSRKDQILADAKLISAERVIKLIKKNADNKANS